MEPTLRTPRMGTELRRLDQANRIEDDDRRQRRVRHQCYQRRQQQHGQRGTRSDQGYLSATARSPRARQRLRGARRPASHRTGHPPCRSQTCRDQFTVGIDRRIFPGARRPGSAAIVSVKLISAMPSAPGANCATSGRSGQRDGCEVPAESRRPWRPRPPASRSTTTWQWRHLPPPAAPARPPKTLHADQHRERCHRHREGRASEVWGRCRSRLRTFRGRSPVFVMWKPKSLGTVEHDHQPDPSLEAGEHRRGNEVGDEAQAQQPGRQQQHADQCGQRGGCRDQLGRVAIRHDQSELGGGQDAQRGVWN